MILRVSAGVIFQFHAEENMIVSPESNKDTVTQRDMKIYGYIHADAKIYLPDRRLASLSVHSFNIVYLFHFLSLLTHPTKIALLLQI